MPTIISVWKKQRIRHRVAHGLSRFDFDERGIPVGWNQESRADVSVCRRCSINALEYNPDFVCRRAIVSSLIVGPPVSVNHQSHSVMRSPFSFRCSVLFFQNCATRLVQLAVRVDTTQIHIQKTHQIPIACHVCLVSSSGLVSLFRLDKVELCITGFFYVMVDGDGGSRR